MRKRLTPLTLLTDEKNETDYETNKSRRSCRCQLNETNRCGRAKPRPPKGGLNKATMNDDERRIYPSLSVVSHFSGQHDTVRQDKQYAAIGCM